MPRGHVAPQAGIGLRDIVAFEAPVASYACGAADGCGEYLLFLRQGGCVEEAVHVEVFRRGLLYLERVFAVQVGCHFIGPAHGFVEIGTSDAVVLYGHGVDSGLEHAHVLAHGLVAHDAGVDHVEVGVELDDGMFLAEGFSPVGDVALVHVLRLEVFELFAVVEMEV